MMALNRKSIVQDTYDQEAERYKTASTMQLFNLRRLLSLADSALRQPNVGKILDVGCGLGPAAGELKERGILDKAQYLGIDLSPQMIARAKEIHKDGAVEFSVGDAEALNVADGSVDLVLSNVALHWLNQPKFGITPAKAFSEIYRVLKPGGVFAVSIPAAGKAERFLKVYRTVLSSYRDTAVFDAAQYVEDPVNRLQLHELVDLALGANFLVELGQLHYQPQKFAEPQGYIDAARAYGFTCFMAPVAAELQEKVWTEISEKFTETTGSGPYVHDLYIAYVIARKPEV
jgi:ubiquinone/menaquinone biosynthesis C-methylase UbiE